MCFGRHPLLNPYIVGARLNFTVGTGPAGIGPRGVNGDGKAVLAATNHNAVTESELLGNRDGKSEHGQS